MHTKYNSYIANESVRPLNNTKRQTVSLFVPNAQSTTKKVPTPQTANAEIMVPSDQVRPPPPTPLLLLIAINGSPVLGME